LIPVPVPPLSEQNRIVNILDEAFACLAKAKANAEQNLKNANELFASYLQNMFAINGEGWEEKSLGDVCDLITKGSSPKWQGIKYVDEPGVLFVTSENVGENTLQLDQRKYVEEKFNLKDCKSILKNGDVLTNIVGASIGRTAIFDLDDVANINQAVCLIRCNQNVLFNEYLMYLLNSPFTKQHLHDNEVNNARANLSLGFFRSLVIPVPAVRIQQSVVSKIKAFHIETQRLEAIYVNKIIDLAELKKSVLQKAFNGELKTA
jgi:restriction endonuclease S subunit